MMAPETPLSLTQVDVRTAHTMLTEDGYTYVDVRSIPEFDQGHPAGAANVPLLHLDAATGQMRPNAEFLAVMQASYPQDARLLLGCQMGARSAQAAQMLLSAGYRDVANVEGGFGGARNRMTGQLVSEGWAGAGLPVEQEAPAERRYDALRAKAADKP